MDKSRTKRTWDRIARSYTKVFIVPNRPSQEDARIYGKMVTEVLGEKKNPNVMLMGATPELRRVLYTFEYLQKACVYCVDINPDMYRAMSDFLMDFDHSREKYLKRSWLDTGVPDKFFDLVVGDEVICNVHAEKQSQLFREISRVLKDDGAWITRHDFYTKAVEKTSAKKILLSMAEKIASGEYDFQYAVNVLLQEMALYTASVSPRDNSIEKHFEILKKVDLGRLKNKKHREILKELLSVYKNEIVPLGGGYRWHMLSKEESERRLKKFFVIRKKLYAKDYPTAYGQPIYFLSKKM